MLDFRLYERILVLENELDKTSKLVHTLRQQQQDMLDQIRNLKERIADDDGK